MDMSVLSALLKKSQPAWHVCSCSAQKSIIRNPCLLLLCSKTDWKKIHVTSLLSLFSHYALRIQNQKLVGLMFCLGLLKKGKGGGKCVDKDSKDPWIRLLCSPRNHTRTSYASGMFTLLCLKFASRRRHVSACSALCKNYTWKSPGSSSNCTNENAYVSCRSALLK